jgi:triosephosphate isomerase (TIM)
MKAHTPLVIGNWKMNPATVGEARKLFLDLRKELGRKARTTIVAVAPPSPFLSELERLNPSERIALAGQDVFFESTGAFTGEVSLPMLKSVGATAIIVGHSERRAHGETDADIYKDILSIIKSNVTAVVCVGEKQRDTQGNYYSIVEAQLRSALAAVPKNKLKQLVIAYEPVWAIGTGKNATPEDVYEMKLFIQKVIVGRYGRPALKTVRIIYGGSVKKDNADILMKIGRVDGFLVGGASLKPKEFIAIINSAEAYATHNA